MTSVGKSWDLSQAQYHQYIDGLLLVEANPLVWWKKYVVNFPNLSQVASRYLSMSVTTAPVERLFSVTGQVVTVKRNRLCPETVTLLVFLHETLPLFRQIQFKRLLESMDMDGDVEVVES